MLRIRDILVRIWIMDPDPTPDPAFFVSDLQVGN